jgi:hypothetical protein
VASSDASHYHSYEKAVEKDSFTIRQLEKMDPKSLLEYSVMGDCELCGAGAIACAMLVCEKFGADRLKVLKYLNSGDTAGNKSRVVGYISAVIYKQGMATAGEYLFTGIAHAAEAEKKGDLMLSREQKKRLLGIARETIEEYLKAGVIPEAEIEDPVFREKFGAFVTLHKNGMLRGCIGNLVGQKPLYKTIQEMAVQSSTADPRFKPVSAGELKDIDIEISVLTPLERTKDPDKIEMGKHGVVIKNGFRSGVYLPQVATETGWTREEFMNSLCSHKAGLPEDAWRQEDTEIYTFTATVFSEKELR